MFVAVTGGIGSGKSIVARLLGELLSAPVFVSDEICRQLLDKDQEGYVAFVNLFGDRFLTDSREIDRALLRVAVFKDNEVRDQVEAILHPLVRLKFHQVRRDSSDGTIQIAEVPLLFECGWEKDFDHIICVITDRETAVKRVVERDKVSRAEVERIMEIQMDTEAKARRSDWLIDNSNDLVDTRKQVEALIELLRVLAGSG